MIEKLLWKTLILTIICVQLSYSRPALENEHNKISLLQSKDVCLQKAKYKKQEPSESASMQLLEFTLNDFQNIAVDSVKTAKAISENILKHPDILSSQSAKVIEFKKNLTQFEDKYSLCDGLEDLFELVEFYTNTTDYYLESEESSLDIDDKLIADLLRKFGAEDLEKKAWSDVKEFLPKFNKKFEDLKDDLNKEREDVGEKLLHWYERFKTLSKIEDKTEAFVDFFFLFEDQEE